MADDVFDAPEVQDTHAYLLRGESVGDALTVAHQLPDAPVVQRRLVALQRMRVGKEAGQGVGAEPVEILQRSRDEPLEVEPVEAALGLLDDLEELRPK